MESFYLKLAEIMEVDEVRADSVLRDYPEWDSLTALSVVAMVHSRYGLSLTAGDLKGVETARDLCGLIEEKRGR
jgi:acyl carrier protein